MIVIKGKMPECCWECDYFDCDTCIKTENCVGDFFDSRPQDCPIVGKIPDKHGDLVEKTEITRKMVHLVNDKGKHFFALKVEDYNNLPVVLEASK